MAELLGAAGRDRGLPLRIEVDNGTESTSRSLDHWAYRKKFELDFSRPGKPSYNAFIESFNATARRECLSQHRFTSLEDVQRTLDTWRDDYNNTRPHGSLAGVPPAKHRSGAYYGQGHQRPEDHPG